VATWEELGVEAIEAAQTLRSAQAWRASVNRAYYGVYGLAAAVLQDAGVAFPAGREGPHHERLARLLRDHATALRPDQRKWLHTLVKGLYVHRIAADYRPGRTVDEAVALDALRAAAIVRRLIGR
jgi:hypothetical protein